MIIHFLQLFTVQIQHEYYDGLCRDFEFIVPRKTAQLLGKGRLLTREVDGILHLLYEAGEVEPSPTPVLYPIAPITGETLRIGLKLTNPHFTNFSDVDPDFLSWLHVYRNSGDPATLSDPERAILTGPLFTHSLVDARPVTVTLRDASNAAIETKVITDAGQTTVTYDLRGKPEGRYFVEESYAPDSRSVPYYMDGELLRMGAAMVIEIEVDESFYSGIYDFIITFEAKNEPLRYYVIATNHSPDDALLLSVSDVGFTSEPRPRVVFAEQPTAFAGEEISYSLLPDGGYPLILFRSSEPIPRRARARKGIQLSRDGETVISDLPQPGPDNAGSHVIVHISKPLL